MAGRERRFRRGGRAAATGIFASLICVATSCGGSARSGSANESVGNDGGPSSPPCSSHAECPDGYCADTGCRPLKGLGQTCGIDDECDLGFCDSTGLCEPLPPEVFDPYNQDGWGFGRSCTGNYDEDRVTCGA
jgi:hypothetical protein